MSDHDNLERFRFGSIHNQVVPNSPKEHRPVFHEILPSMPNSWISSEKAEGLNEFSQHLPGDARPGFFQIVIPNVDEIFLRRGARI